MWIAIFFLRWAFSPVVLYLKRRHKNTGIRAFTSVLQMCHGHVLNVFDHSLNIALWNVHNMCRYELRGTYFQFLLNAISYIVNTTAHLSVRFPVTSVYSPVQWNSTLNQLNPVHCCSVCIEREFYMIDTRFSALHVFITQSTIKHDQQLFFTLTEPTTNKNDFHHHIDLDAGSIM